VTITAYIQITNPCASSINFNPFPSDFNEYYNISDPGYTFKLQKVTHDRPDCPDVTY
jgi:hypothetical protein